ncbi:hypothetical protein M885DRAFT_475387 [Pelagophyceae sp. CCMP2097]|nr:hypothetical protein M885DRAFT_475387 [Pelagophyceae sp. CCMP2097]
MRSSSRAAAEKVEASVFDHLPQPPADDAAADSFSLFVGQRASGKSSLLALLQTSLTKEQPKPTVALEYVFARRSAKTGTAKDVAHIWELGGGTHLEQLVGVPITPQRLPRCVLGLVVDLSTPSDAVLCLGHWMKTLRTHVSGALEALKKTAEGSRVAEKLVDEAKARYSERKPEKKGDRPVEHPDRRAIDASAIPILVVCNKYDVFKDLEPSQKKALAQALRFVAHSNGATLVFASAKDKALQNSFRALLSFALFLKADKTARVELSSDKPVYVPAGADSLEEIFKAGPLKLSGVSTRKSPVGGLSDEATSQLQALVDDFFGPPQLCPPGDADAVAPGDAAEFAEAAVDELYKQKIDALTRYRKKIEQKEKEGDLERKRRAAPAKPSSSSRPSSSSSASLKESKATS